MNKKKKSKFDEVRKFKKFGGTYDGMPPMNLNEIIDEVLKDGNLKNVPIFYDNFDDKDQRAIEEVVI